MKYRTATAFRAALETRLIAQSREHNMPLVRLRKAIAFDRLLARLAADPTGSWVLKGGYALQLRLDQVHDVRPRTTRDVDLQSSLSPEDVRASLIRAVRIPLGDWVQFDVSEMTAPRDDEQVQENGTLRSQMVMRLDSRPFETFHVDIGLGSLPSQPADLLTLPPLLEFAGISPVQVLCYPLIMHVAEKVHAYTRERAGGPSTRVKDLVDILLIAELGEAMSSVELRNALDMVFDAGSTPLPLRLPEPPLNWDKPYRELASEARLPQLSLVDAITSARCFIDPVLSNSAGLLWSRKQWKWE